MPSILVSTKSSPFSDKIRRRLHRSGIISSSGDRTNLEGENLDDSVVWTPLEIQSGPLKKHSLGLFS
jgi:hypothetical protein